MNGCEGACESSCIDCLQTFRNSYYHNRLDRRVALDALKEWGRGLVFQHDIPLKRPASSPSGDAVPVNQAERSFAICSCGPVSEKECEENGFGWAER